MIFFNGIKDSDLNIISKTSPIHPINKRYTETTIDGKDGSLYIDDCFDDINIEVVLKCNCKKRGHNIDDILYWLDNVEDNRLLVNKMQNDCYHVKKVIIDNIEYSSTNVIEITVTFICDPYKYDLDNTVVNVTNNSVINYTGLIPADTLFEITASGDITLNINGEEIRIINCDGTIVIDSKLMQVRNSDGTSKDWDTLGNFNKLKRGSNVISYTGSITSCKLTYINTYK